MMHQVYLDAVVETFTTGEYYREVYNAKNEFFQKAGPVNEDDVEFEDRMCLFMDWYIFDRDLPGVDLPPIRYFLKLRRDKLSPEDSQIYEGFCTTIHSIFRMRGRPLFRKTLEIQDLFSDKVYSVPHADRGGGFSRGDIFEARLIPFGGQFAFSKGFCFHPIEIEDYILREVKKIRFQDPLRHSKLIFQLSSMKLKHLHYPHIDIRHIYSSESRF